MLLCTLVSKIHSGKNLKETNYLFYGFRPVLIRVGTENVLNSISFDNEKNSCRVKFLFKFDGKYSISENVIEII